MKPKGWKNEPGRHSLAARGVKTGKKPDYDTMTDDMILSSKFKKRFDKTLSFWDNLNQRERQEIIEDYNEIVSFPGQEVSMNSARRDPDFLIYLEDIPMRSGWGLQL